MVWWAGTVWVEDHKPQGFVATFLTCVTRLSLPESQGLLCKGSEEFLLLTLFIGLRRIKKSIKRPRKELVYK